MRTSFLGKVHVMPSKYDPETRGKAVRLVLERRDDYPSERGSDDDRDGWRIHGGARIDPASEVRRVGQGGLLVAEDPADDHHQSRPVSRPRGRHGYRRAWAQRRPGGTGRQSARQRRKPASDQRRGQSGHALLGRGAGNTQGPRSNGSWLLVLCDACALAIAEGWAPRRLPPRLELGRVAQPLWRGARHERSDPPGGGCAMSSTDEVRDGFVERLFASALGTMDVFTVYLGDRLGLYRMLAEHGPLTAGALAEHAGMNARYAREWLE